MNRENGVEQSYISYLHNAMHEENENSFQNPNKIPEGYFLPGINTFESNTNQQLDFKHIPQIPLTKNSDQNPFHIGEQHDYSGHITMSEPSTNFIQAPSFGLPQTLTFPNQNQFKQHDSPEGQYENTKDDQDLTEEEKAPKRRKGPKKEEKIKRSDKYSHLFELCPGQDKIKLERVVINGKLW